MTRARTAYREGSRHDPFGPAEPLSARPIREGVNLEAVVIELLMAGAK